MGATGQRFRILGILPLLIVVVLVAGRGSPAQAADYASIVMDLRDGTVYAATAPDRRQQPASLTKMMTLYLVFEAVESGQLRLDQRVVISRRAAAQPPSRLGLRAGQRVSIRSLIRAAAIKSANDAAVALAEAVAGSESEFARLMTQKARELGMRNTTFRNATGLTRRGHLSTARDMAILARHLFFDFPEYYNIFGRTSTYAAGKRIWTTNRLLRSYRGADGIKTGFTRAAGYNLAASARRGDKRIVAVVLGGKSSRWRNAEMRRLLDLGFRKAPTRVAMVPPRGLAAAVARAPLPPERPTGSGGTGLVALAQAVAPAAEAATVEPGSVFAPIYAAVPEARPSGATIAGSGEFVDVPLPQPRPSAVALGALPAAGGEG